MSLYLRISVLHYFKGRLLLSHYYSQPEDFKGKRVVLLGNGASGEDVNPLNTSPTKWSSTLKQFVGC